jgi:Protein of unknown function (DUF3632)
MTTQYNWIQSTKAEIDAQVTKGDTSGIERTFRGLSQTFTTGEPQSLGPKLHLLWYILVRGARNLGPETFGQYHMVHTILYLREMGTLSQRTESGEEKVVEVEHRKLWADLPYLFEDVEAAWKDDDKNITENQRKNLVAFVAKMVAVGICGDNFVDLAQNSFNEVVQEASTSPCIGTLHMVLMWFTYAGDKLTVLSSKMLRGMSPEGWLSLQSRLAELTVIDNGEVALLAMEIYLKMYECV